MSTPDFVAAAPYGAYIFLGLMCVLAAAYVYWFVPETKNRSLDELDEIFGDTSGRSLWEAKVMQQARKDTGLLSALDMENSTANTGGKEKLASHHSR